MNVTAETIKTIVNELRETADHSNEKARQIIFSHVRLSDFVPLKYADSFKKIIFRCFYDKHGFGYSGIVNEVEKRLYTMSRSKKVQEEGGIRVRDFMLHTMKEADTIDHDKRISYEEKSGCGDWLRSDNPNFDEVIKEYSRKRSLIRWDYTFMVETKEGQEEYNVYIETTWKKLFSFLAEYNDKGLKTWFKENARSGRSGLYVWEMNTIRTSKKKADYLLTFDDWDNE